MIAFDTSVLVAGFGSWHEHHESAVAALDVAAAPALIAPCALETVSTLTRMPEPLRIAASDVVRYLRSWFGSELIALDARASSTLIDELVGRGSAGGAVYDGLVAATARAPRGDAHERLPPRPANLLGARRLGGLAARDELTRFTATPCLHGDPPGDAVALT